MSRRDQPLEREEAKCPYVADCINVPVQPAMQLVETPEGWGVWNRDRKAISMTTTNAMRLASLVTAINVLVASGFSIAAIFRPEAVVPAGSIPTEASLLLAMYAAARTIPLAFCIGGNLQTSDVCFADPGHAGGRRAIAGCRNRSVSA